MTPSVLQLIADSIYTTRIDMSLEEAMQLYPKIDAWAKANGRKPERRTDDPEERQLADALLVIQKAVADRKAEKAAQSTADSDDS